MNTNRWTKFVKRITVNAETRAIYLAIVTSAGLEKWFLRKALFLDKNGVKRHPNELIQEEDTYQWYWHGHPDTSTEAGKIMEGNGKDYISFNFTDDSLVSIQIKQEEGETIVELIQDKIKPDDDPDTNLYLVCSIGWTFYLANLKSVMEGGLDLRNRNENIKKVINS